MHCDQARELLNIVCDGERLPNRRLALLLVWHCVTCGSCRAYKRQLQRLRHTARHLLSVGTPDPLRARVMSALPDSLPPSIVSAKKGSYPMTLRLVGGGLALTAILAIGLLTVPRSHHTNTSLASEDIRKALAHVNTWHLHGWKLKNGQQVPWEIWGRHTPFFYREQIGEEMTLDDAHQRVQVLAQDSAAGKGRHVVLKMDSRPGPENTGWTFTALATWHGIPRTAAKTSETVTYILGESQSIGRYPSRQRDLLTVDAGTALPMHYDQQMTQYRNMEILTRPTDAPDDPKLIEKVWTAAHLDAEYDVALPASEEAEVASSTDTLVDMRAEAPRPDVPTENTATKAGLTVQAEPLAMDPQGNVVVQFRGWLGNTPLDEKRMPLHFQVLPQSPMYGSAVGDYIKKTTDYDPVFVRDEHGAGYTNVDRTVFPLGFMLLTPLEPSRIQSPRTLTIRLIGSVTQFFTDEKGQGHESAPLMSENLDIVVQLPLQRHPLDQVALMKRYRIHSYVETLDPLDMVSAEARANAYMNTLDKRSAARWWQKALALSHKVNDAQMYRSNLAVADYMLGEKTKALQLLHEVLAVAKSNPKEGGFAKTSAEVNLKNWSKH